MKGPWWFLGPLERAAVGLSFRFSDRFGSHGHAGSFVLAPSGTLDAEARAELGCLSFSARFDILRDSATSALPAVALTAGLGLPTGRSAANAKSPLATDATGLGAAEVRPGMFVEKNVGGEAT